MIIIQTPPLRQAKVYNSFTYSVLTGRFQRHCLSTRHCTESNSQLDDGKPHTCGPRTSYLRQRRLPPLPARGKRQGFAERSAQCGQASCDARALPLVLARDKGVVAAPFRIQAVTRTEVPRSAAAATPCAPDRNRKIFRLHRKIRPQEGSRTR